MNAIRTAGGEHIRAADFREWLVKANPGERIVYCTGELAKSPHFAFLNNDPKCAGAGGAATIDLRGARRRTEEE
jgi:hypothetical protein